MQSSTLSLVKKAAERCSREQPSVGCSLDQNNINSIKCLSHLFFLDCRGINLVVQLCSFAVFSFQCDSEGHQVCLLVASCPFPLLSLEDLRSFHHGVGGERCESEGARPGRAGSCVLCSRLPSGQECSQRGRELSAWEAGRAVGPFRLPLPLRAWPCPSPTPLIIH